MACYGDEPVGFAADTADVSGLMFTVVQKGGSW